MLSVTVPYRIAPDHNELFSDTLRDALRKLGANRLAMWFENWTDVAVNTGILRQAVPYFAGCGIDTAVWLPSMLHNTGKAFTPRVYADGTEKFSCPLDADYAAWYATIVAGYAGSGVKLIFLDDDFRFGISGGWNCFCELHMRAYSEALGTSVTRAEMLAGLADSRPNRYRDCWMAVNGKALESFARTVRAAVDRVNPSVRLGLCASPTTYDVDGTDSFTLSKILAGHTKPFLRLIGAPYWASAIRKCSLADVIGLERLQLFWADKCGFAGELLAEGDTYPRPRYVVPAGWLEIFHSALSAENRLSGILKYGVDYYSSAAYETGYYAAAERCKPVTDRIAEAFFGTVKTGYRVREDMHKLSEASWPGAVDPDVVEWDMPCFSPALRFLNDTGMPCNFTEGPVVAFGDNVRHLSRAEMRQGVVTDLPGARMLQTRGFDTGIRKAEPFVPSLPEKFLGGPYCEFYRRYDDKVLLQGIHDFTKLTLADGATVLTDFDLQGECIPACYTYDSEIRYLVFAYDMREKRETPGLHRSYYKQRLMAEEYSWLCGSKLPAYCPKHPDLLTIVGRRNRQTVIGLWNIFPDPMETFEILLGFSCRRAEFIGCTGRADKDRIYVERLEAYAFAAVVAEG